MVACCMGAATKGKYDSGGRNDRTHHHRRLSPLAG
jgi:hypothetical protein